MWIGSGDWSHAFIPLLSFVETDLINFPVLPNFQWFPLLNYTVLYCVFSLGFILFLTMLFIPLLFFAMIASVHGRVQVLTHAIGLAYVGTA